MRITIWDMDFYYNKRPTPDPDLMRISSFHKQQGDLINFVTEEFHIDLAYDIFYILRDTRMTPPAPSRITDNQRARLMGRTFRFYPNRYKIDAVIAAVRPDYLLYPEKNKDAYYNAEIIQFFFEGQFIETRQPIEHSLTEQKKTLVVDMDFWEQSEENIEKALTELLNYKKIAFLSQIRLKILIKNKKIQDLFLKLKFNVGTIFNFRNDYGSTFTEAKEIIDFYVELKNANPYVNMGMIPIRTVLLDHWADKQNPLDDIERTLKIAAYAKWRKASLLLVAPARRKFETPYWYYFEPFEAWSRYMWTLSYVEFMLNGAVKRYNMFWFQILNDSMKWALPNTNYLLHLMANHNDIIEEYGFIQWGETKAPRELVTDEYKKYKKIEILEEEEEE